jgi:DNA repair protein RecO
MSEESITTNGIVLRSINVKDHDRIAVLFTRDHGLVKVYLAGAKWRNHQAEVSSSPLVESEWILKEGRDELYLLREASVITQNLHLRSNLAALQAACDMLKSSESGLVAGDPAPALYDLLQLFLSNLVEAESPATVKAVYQLKFLLYQGLIGENDTTALLELAELRSLQALLATTLPDEVIDIIHELYHERFVMI